MNKLLPSRFSHNYCEQPSSRKPCSDKICIYSLNTLNHSHIGAEAHGNLQELCCIFYELLDVLIDNSLRINVNVTIFLPFLMVYVKLVCL